MSKQEGPLAGITVVDFTQMMAGPFATQLLADLGASVVKVEKPVTGEWERGLSSMGEYFHGQSPFFLAMNRGKRSLAVDLKSEAGRAVVRKLIEKADVVTSNFRPGTLERLGFGFDDVRAINPHAVYASSSGYGTTGPWAKRPGQDLLLQAVSGMLAQSGRSGELPTPVANSVIDAMTALYNVVGILAALVGRGKAIDVGEIQVSMLEAAIAIQCQEISAHINLNQRFERSSSGLAAPWNDAPYGVYETQRGSIAIAMADLALLGKILEVPELNLIASTGDTFSQRDRARVVLQEAALVFRRDDLVDLLLQHDVWCAPVLGFEEVTELEQVADSGILKTLHHEIYGSFVTPGLPVGFSNFEPSYEAAPPLPGEHTDEILRELGLSDAEIQDLKAGKYISSPKSSEDA